MAKTAPQTKSSAKSAAEATAKPASSARGSDIARKAAAVAQKMAILRADLAAAHGLIQQAQVREALTRTELTLALYAAMRGRAEAEAIARRRAAQTYLERAERRALRRRDRLAEALEQQLVKRGRAGQAQVIANAGVWRGGDLAAIKAYVARGSDPLAQPAALFDQAWYLRTYPDAAASGVSPLAHYLSQGTFAGHDPHPLLSEDFYRLGAGAGLAEARVSSLEHFVAVGAAEGRDPHPLFSVLHYVSQWPQLAAGEDPLSHYLRAGWREGLSPHPLFDAVWYRRQIPRADADVAPLLHYVTVGRGMGLSPHPLFDPAWYLEQNPDVAATGADPLGHFLASGAAEGRAPSPWFDLTRHVAARGEALDPSVNPLVDYVQGGAWAVSETRPGFPTAAYLAQHPELIAQGITPLEHWARQGGRPPPAP